MTREEAIETLKENYCAMCAYGSQNMMSCDIRGCDNRDAIKALELEPCDDAISKQAVLECFTWTNDKAAEIPDNATNGDMIKALFPHGKQETREPIMRFAIDNYAYEFSYKWWNAPYKTESEEV